MIPRDIRNLGRVRLQLIRQLAPVLRRAGPNHPDRQVENKRRAATRKQIKKDLQANANAIASLVMSHIQRLRK